MANVNPQQLEKVDIQERWNSRNIKERFIKGRHVSLQTLREQMPQVRPRDRMIRYIIKELPPYPSPVEFWVSDVAHVTVESGFQGILESEDFRPGARGFSWWGLKINEEEIHTAEERYMEKHFPNAAQELNEQQPFLKKFTTSPLFQLEKSRYGNYRFTFPLTELMERYKEQNCGGKEPVLRVYETTTYIQEIMYTVLIHSPENNKHFEEYPLLEESEIVQYRDGKIVWQAQAICETHRYQFVSGEVQELNTHMFYVWDHVSLVFHLPNHTTPRKGIKIPRKRLIEALEACEIDETINLSGHKGAKNNPKECNLKAMMNVRELKRELEEEGERKRQRRGC